jgi:hypothetical protein
MRPFYEFLYFLTAVICFIFGAGCAIHLLGNWVGAHFFGHAPLSLEETTLHVRLVIIFCFTSAGLFYKLAFMDLVRQRRELRKEYGG